MKIYSIIGSLVLAILIGCSTKKNIEITNIYSKTQNVSVSFDTIILFPPSYSSGTFKLYGSVAQSSKFYTSSLDIKNKAINLYGNAEGKRITLKDTVFFSQKYLAEAYSFISLNDTSHIIITEKLIHYIDHLGIEKKRIIITPEQKQIQLLNQGFNCCLFDLETNCIFIPIFSESIKDNKPGSFVFEGKLNLENGHLERLYPKGWDEFLEFKMGMLNQFSRCLNDSLIVYSFPSSPYIQVYNINTQTEKSYPCISKYQTPFKYLKYDTKTSHSELMDHKKTANRYGAVYFDKGRELFYRFYYKGQELKKTTTIFNVFNDMPTSIIISNKNFEIIDEIDVPNNISRDILPVMLDQGLMLFPQSGDSMKYKRIMLDVKIEENSSH